MKETLLEFALSTAKKLIEETSDDDLNEKQLRLLANAHMIELMIEKGPEILQRVEDEIIAKENISLGEISKEYVLRKALEKNKLFMKLAAHYDAGVETINDLTSAMIFEIWQKSTEYNSIEKYFNTPDDLFNSNAFHWRIELKANGLFADLEVPFRILSRYFDFLESPDKPITTVDKVIADFENEQLNLKQRIFILDKLTGMLFHSDNPVLSNIFIELVDRRHDLSSYLDDPEVTENIWDIERLRTESEEYKTIPERKRYFRLKQLEYGKESENLGFDIGVKEEIDIELKYLEELEKREEIIEDNLSKITEDKTIAKIGDRAYDQIIRYILRLGKNLEKLKELAQNFDEEKCRDYFLPFLNAISDNHSATGETFNKIGRTDILIQNNEGDNVFIGECKIWKGESKLSEAIDQLLDRYVNWRDEKVALVIFNKENKGFTRVRRCCMNNG